MGILNPVCVATDGTYVYALAYAPSFNDSSSSYNILIKSNANPPYTLDNLSWTLVSAVPRDAYYYLGEDNINGHDYGCLADATGVFTALARSSKSSRDAAADNVSRGLQYQPYGNVWKNVSTSQGYVWNELSSSQLVNIKDPVTGVTAIIHASIASHNSTSAIAVAALNTNTLTMIQNPSMWSLDLNKFGLMQGLAILGNGTMYGIGRNLTSNFMQRAALTAIPISNGSTVAPFEDSLIPISADGLAGACGDDINGLNMLPWGNKIVFTCASPSSAQSYSDVFIYDGKLSSMLGYYPGAFDNFRSSAIVQGSSGSYIFIHNSTGVFSAPVEGGFVGIWQSSNARISIADHYGSNPNPSSVPASTQPSSSTQNLGNGTGSSSNAGLIGGVCAALVVLAAAVYAFYNRRRRQAQNKVQPPAQPVQQQLPGAICDGKFDAGDAPFEATMKSEVLGPWPRHVRTVQQHQQQHFLYLPSVPPTGTTPPYLPSLPLASNILNSPGAMDIQLPVIIHAPHTSPVISLIEPNSSHSVSAWEPQPFIPPNANTSPPSLDAYPSSIHSPSQTQTPSVPRRTRPSINQIPLN